MVLRKIGILFLGLALFSCTESNGLEKESQAMSTDEPKGETGMRLYERNCSNCHGMDGRLGNSGAKDLTASKMTDEQIIEILEEGKNAMPPMAMLMENPSDMDSIVVFVKSLRK